jgi:hypothetical protein
MLKLITKELIIPLTIAIIGSTISITIYKKYKEPKVYVLDIQYLVAKGYPLQKIFEAIEEEDKIKKGTIIDKNLVIYSPDAIDITPLIDQDLSKNNK